jgi:DNA-binding MarR family transcriptional regulator
MSRTMGPNPMGPDQTGPVQTGPKDREMKQNAYGTTRTPTPAAPTTATLSLLTQPKDPRLAATAGANLLFLREEEIRLAQDLLFFAYRDFTNGADVILEELGFGRAHHRTLHFIGRNPGITVSDLLSILRITKQSLARVLNVLMEQGYVAQAQGHSDRRQRLLTLTQSGQALERRLFERQRERLLAAYRDAGGAAVEGFRLVMRGIMDETARAYLDQTDPNEARAKRA